MNIFYLDHDPIQAARWMVDKHVVKMILETAQLLSTAHRVLDGVEKIEERYVAGSFPPRYRKHKIWVLPDARQNVMYSATHMNHPSAIWCRNSIENYLWLVEHMYALMDEYTYRYEKKHKCQGELSYMLQSPPKNLTDYEFTSIPSAMAEEYRISNDPIVNYRNYYKLGKTNLHSWKKREQPEWITA